jgi:hypothetical protein
VPRVLALARCKRKIETHKLMSWAERELAMLIYGARAPMRPSVRRSISSSRLALEAIVRCGVMRGVVWVAARLELALLIALDCDR